MPFDLGETTLVNAQRQQGEENKEWCWIPSTTKESHCHCGCTPTADAAAKANAQVVEISEVRRESHRAAGVVGSVELAFTAGMGAALLKGVTGDFLIDLL